MNKLFFLSLLALLFPSLSFSAMINVSVSGTVANVPSPLSSEFTPGDNVQIDIVFNTNVSDSNPDLNEGQYNNAIESWVMSIDDYQLTGLGNVTIRNDNRGDDELSFNTLFPQGNSVGSFFPRLVAFTIEYDDSLLSSDAISALDINSLNAAVSGRQTSLVSFQTSTNDFRNFGFFVDDVTYAAVPLPAAAWLFGSAIIGLTGMRKFNK